MEDVIREGVGILIDWSFGYERGLVVGRRSHSKGTQFMFLGLHLKKFGDVKVERNQYLLRTNC